MKVSTKGIYGALAVLDLAIHQATGHVHKAEIAERQEIPDQYLAQLLSVLRRAGIVRSVRGPSGGHTLAKDPSEISVGEIIELLDGPQHSDGLATPGEPAGKQLIFNLIHEADMAASRVLGAVTFDTLVERWRHEEGAFDFVI
jgi:Rrf2 family protein